MAAVTWIVMLGAAVLFNSDLSTAQGGQIVHYSGIILAPGGNFRGLTETVVVAENRQEKVNVFWGIPYAKPPVGNLRFKPPVRVGRLGGRFFDATKPPNSCYQPLPPNPVIVPKPPTPLSEDCLYLNVWVPRCKKEELGLPVMVWFHGHYCLTGSSTVQAYNGALLAASECVIVVNFNYRIGVLGFLALNDMENKGNMGFLDAIMALEWINRNIVYFGGTTAKIIPFGSSGGSALVSALMFSPQARHLFNSVILQSGTALMPLAYQNRSRAEQVSLEFARNFNCTSANRAQVVNCLRKVSPEALVQYNVFLAEDLTKFFTLTDDGYSITRSPVELLKLATFKPCKMLLGTNKNDGTILMEVLYPTQFDFRKEENPTFSNEELDKKLNDIMQVAFEDDFIPQIIADAKSLYIQTPQTPEDNFKLYAEITTDVAFTCPTRAMASAAAALLNSVYLYSFEHFPDHTTLGEWVGVTHLVELIFTLGNNVQDIFEFSPRERQLVRSIMKMWANFAKFGNPTHQGTSNHWHKYDGPDPGNIHVITGNGSFNAQTDGKYCDYWINLPTNYFKN